MVTPLKYMGETSRKAIFIIGQLMPHISVMPTKPMSCWRLMTLVPPVTRPPAP